MERLKFKEEYDKKIAQQVENDEKQKNIMDHRKKEQETRKKKIEGKMIQGHRPTPSPEQVTYDNEIKDDYKKQLDAHKQTDAKTKEDVDTLFKQVEKVFKAHNKQLKVL